MTATNIRKMARESLSGKWGKAVLITICYALIVFAFNLLKSFTGKVPILGSIVSIGILVISVPLSFGLLVSFIKLKRGEDVKAFDFLTCAFSSYFSRAWKISFRMFLKLIIPFILVVISFVFITVGITSMMMFDNGIVDAAQQSNAETQYYTELEQAQLQLYKAQFNYSKNPTDANRQALNEAQEKFDNINSSKDSYISSNSSNISSDSSFGTILIVAGFVLLFVSSVWFYIKQLHYVLSYNIAYDEPFLSSKDVVLKSKLLMKGNRGNYFVLTLSFIGWVILAVFTLGIGYLWLLPYVQVSTICFYEVLSNKE